MPAAIVFDFDGVIVDTEPLHYQAFLRVLAPFGVDFDYGRYQRDYIGFDDRDGFDAILGDFAIDLGTATRRDLVEAKAAAFEQVLGNNARAYPGVLELIAEAGAALPLAICSGARRSDIDLIIPALGNGPLLNFFQAVVTADDVANSKPDPQPYRLAAEQLGIDPDQCLAIEDTPTGLQSAWAAGLATLGVAHTFGPDHLEQADRVVTDLAGVTLADLRGWFP